MLHELCARVCEVFLELTHFSVTPAGKEGSIAMVGSNSNNGEIHPLTSLGRQLIYCRLRITKPTKPT